MLLWDVEGVESNGLFAAARVSLMSRGLVLSNTKLGHYVVQLGCQLGRHLAGSSSRVQVADNTGEQYSRNHDGEQTHHEDFHWAPARHLLYFGSACRDSLTGQCHLGLILLW